MREAALRWLIVLAASLVAAVCDVGAASAGVSRHVNPFIGTDGTGHTTPAAVAPFGMVAPGPDNSDRGWSYSSGYQFRAPVILGFSNTHISGAGIPELGDILLQPVSGSPWTASTTSFATAPDKTTERAAPGSYQVRLPGNGVTVALTASPRVAVHRYRFDKAVAAQVLVDLQHGLHFVEGPRVTGASSAVDMGRGEITGTIQSRNWVTREASFIVRFDRPVTRIIELPLRPGDKAARYVVSFQLDATRTVEARVALSTVDVEGARNNLAEMDSRSFAEIRAATAARWERMLSRVTISGDARHKRIFYSALYRAMIHPSDIADRDGRVRGPKGEVIQAPDGRYYSTLSLWDTFRGVHPLLTLVAPERVAGFVNTMTAHHQQMGYLPLWTAWGRETWTMIGNPALPVMADAIVKGIEGIDREAALRAMVETSTRERPDAPQWAQRSWAAYDQLGYVPFDGAPGESVSKSLEYGYGDAAVASVARVLGDEALAARFERRAQGYRLLFDAETGAMRGRDSAGQWRTPFDPGKATSPMNNPGDYTEANAWQYTLTPALHDPLGMRDLLGGPAGLERWLDRFFTADGSSAPADRHLGQEALIGHYAHGNEPSHHIAWLYAWTPAPWKGQAITRRIATSFYGDGPDGIIGNDDAGQMGAWFVLATMGIYPVQPGEGVWTLGTPLVDRISLNVPGQKPLTITRAASKRDAARARLNGQALPGPEIPHAALQAGGRLNLQPWAE